MEALIVGATVAGTFMAAFALQKAALEGLFRVMKTERRARE